MDTAVCTELIADFTAYGNFWLQGNRLGPLMLFALLLGMWFFSGCCLSVRFPVQLVISSVSFS